MAGTVVQAGEVRVARVESLRALAALGVLVGHAYLFTHGALPGPSLASHLLLGGGYGVYLFFALTGYLLFWPFVQGKVDLARYARNRVLRIVPLYVIAVVILLVAQGGDHDWWRFVLGLQNFSGSTVASANDLDPSLWSVIVEIHFYLLLPLLAIVARRWAGLAVLAAAAVALHGAGDSALWTYNLPGTFVFFVPGMLLALLRDELERRRVRLGRSDVWLVAAVVVWLVVLHRFRDDLLIALATFLTVGACVLPLRESALRGALDWRPLAAVGVASYSLYVWHLPILHALFVKVSTAHALMLAGVVLSVAVAFASYRLIEAPFLRLRRRWSDASARILDDGWPANATSSSTPS